MDARGSGSYTKNDVVNDGVLYMVSSTGGPYTCPGAGCYELARGGQFSSADQAGAGGPLNGPHTTLPKFAPFAQGPTGNIVFIAFTTRIAYGWLSDAGNSQIWMFGIDLNNLASGDPSYTPIWLPYQEPADGSLAPFWAAIAPCASPEGGGCSCAVGESCVFDQNNVCSCVFDGVPR
jgi:hypothetical protein